MIEAILILTAVWVGTLIWKDRIRERKFQEGLDKVKAFVDEHPAFLLDDDEDDEGWYTYLDLNSCTICDDVVFEDEAITLIPAEDGGMLAFCEYCLNPALKG